MHKSSHLFVFQAHVFSVMFYLVSVSMWSGGFENFRNLTWLSCTSVISSEIDNCLTSIILDINNELRTYQKYEKQNA